MTSACDQPARRPTSPCVATPHLAWGISNRGRADAPAIAKELARELKWPPGRVQTALSDYEQALSAEGL